MAKITNLNKSRTIAAAVRAIDDLTCLLPMPGNGGSIRRRDDIIRTGIPGTVAAIDHMLDLQRQILGIGHGFARFLADHPEAPGLVPQDFAHGTIERELLVYVQAVIVGDTDADAGRGTLFDAIEHALPGLFEDEQHEPHMRRAEALHLLAHAQSNVDALLNIRGLLAPLMDGAPAISIPKGLDKPQVKLVRWMVSEIVVGDRIRKNLNEDTVRELMASIQRLGLRQPPTIRIEVDGRGRETAILVAGLHRVEACRRLGLEVIDCWKFHGDETDARLWEIAENLHRAELTVQERADHVAAWVKLAELQSGHLVHNESKQADGEVGQVVQPHIRSHGRALDLGISKAARELPIPGPSEDAKRKSVERAIKIAGIAPEAKKAAAAAGLANNQKALLTVAQAEPEQQTRVVEEIAVRKAQKPMDTNAVDREVDRLMAAWNEAGEEARRMFLGRVGQG